MKNIIRLLLLVGLSSSLFLAGCTARVYGVPKEEWHRMTPVEQQQARKAYEERRRLYEERRLYEAKQRAHEAELKARQAREEASHNPAPHRHDQVPELIHFTLEGGTVYVAGRHHPFNPVTVALRQGESKRLVLVTSDERRPHHVQLVCGYEKGVLWLSNGKSRVHTQQFSYNNHWRNGQHYQNLEVGGAVGLRGGILRVGSGAMPAATSSRSHGNNRNEKPHGQEKKENTCRDDRGRIVRPGPGENCNAPDKAAKQDKRFPATPAAPAANGRKVSKADGDDASGHTPRPNTFGSAAAQALEKMTRGGANQDERKGKSHSQESKPSHEKNPQRQATTSAKAAPALEKMNHGGANQDETKGKPHQQESKPSHEKNPQRQGAAPSKAKGQAKEKQQSGKSKNGECIKDAAAGKKGEHGCDDEPDAGKGLAKGKSHQ